VAKISSIVRARRPAKYKTRQKNRCQRCGRPRAFIRQFSLCRICFRQLAHVGQLPGVKKASL
jgi:small subunit ribosomal protein S14